MIIDFHSHVFPDKVALKSIPMIATRDAIPNRLSGTASDLYASMAKNKVTHTVVLPVATNPKKQSSVNDYAASLTKRDGTLAFGSVHPASDDWREELKRFKELGLIGLKIHNDYQKFYFYTDECYAIIEAAYAEGLIVLAHVGYDPVARNIQRCTPRMVADALPLLTKGDFIAAHLGGHLRLHEAMKVLLGSDIYIDTGMVHMYYPLKTCREAIMLHNPDKVLFGTDTPWESLETAIEATINMDLGPELTDKVFYKNALNLLAKHNISL